MNTFKKRWNGKSVRDDGCFMSDEGRSFAKCFRNMLARTIPNCHINIRTGHYDVSGFIERDGKYVYVSYNIPRYGARIDFKKSNAHDGVLYRTAAGPRDYTGGTNNFCSMLELPKAVNRMLEGGRW